MGMKNVKAKLSVAVACLTLTHLLAQPVFAAQSFTQVTSKAEDIVATRDAVRKKLPKVAPVLIDKITKYLVSVKLTPDKGNFNFQLTRLLNSSTQFIFCDDPENWECLEQKPTIDPKSKMRVETMIGLGAPVPAGDSLQLEYFFTQGWYNNYVNNTQKNYVIPDTTVAEIMAEKIRAEGEKKIFMAMYGIDDIQDTMSSVFNAIADKVKAGVSTYAVVDVSDEGAPNTFARDYNISKLPNGQYSLGDKKIELDWAYVNPTDKDNAAFLPPSWAHEYLTDVAVLSKTMNQTEQRKYLLNEMFIKPEATSAYDKQVADLNWIAVNKDLSNYQQELSRITFQYSNTLQLLRLVNSTATTNEQARGRIEFPFKAIMHNKFIVFEKNNGERSVWSGTTNVSRTCMGDEANSNLAILIKNTPIANAFLAEFTEMHQGHNDSSAKPKTLLTGAFHDKKRANTQRYFTFTDGTDVRLHFSPTDDGEHRVIIPFINSAKPGDLIRISMFGGGGYELVRAMQLAAARGVKIRIVFDKLTGAGPTSWWKSKDANVLEQNPYVAQPKGFIELRKNAWNGLNHHKSATLSRLQKDGSYKTEVIIVGSQNWSQTGNDLNDENMVTIRNKKKELEIMKAFNEEFDTKMWPSSVPATANETVLAETVEE